MATKQDALKTALTALADTLGAAETQVASVPGSPPSSPSRPSTRPRRSTPAAGAPPPHRARATGGAGVTAARLAQDQASIDSAEAGLTRARAERSLATLRAPYAGRVLEVGVARHDQVGASDVAVVLVGRGVTTVTSTLSTAQVPTVRQGQRVTVTPAGGARP